MSAPLVKVQVPEPKDRWKSWAKLLTGIDRSRKDGYAFQGPWLKRGCLDELPVGSLVLLYDEAGSRRYHKPCVEVMLVREDSSLAPAQDSHGPLYAEGWDWALLLRDRVASLLGATSDRPLKEVATAQLAEELARRQDGVRSLVDALLARLVMSDPLAIALAGELLSSLPDLQAAAEAAKRRLAATGGELTTAAGQEVV